MNPAASGARPLQYFIHDDFDALRMEISGSLAGRGAQAAYDDFRKESFLTRRHPMVIDISYVTDFDERGREVLRAWQGQGARIVAAPEASAVSDQRRSGGVLQGIFDLAH